MEANREPQARIERDQVITADTITDDQIRELRRTAKAYADGDPDFVIGLCNRALGSCEIGWRRARARCAEILNARAVK